MSQSTSLKVSRLYARMCDRRTSVLFLPVTTLSILYRFTVGGQLDDPQPLSLVRSNIFTALLMLISCSLRRNSFILTLTALRSEDALELFLPCLYLFREYGPRSFNYTAEADSQYILYVRPLT